MFFSFFFQYVWFNQVWQTALGLLAAHEGEQVSYKHTDDLSFENNVLLQFIWGESKLVLEVVET